MTRWAALVALGACLAAAGNADASDLAVENLEWNGLSGFAAALRRASVDLHADATFDLATVEPGSTVAIIGVDIPSGIADALHRFVLEGGRLLLADEGPGADALLERFGLVRSAAPRNGQPRAGGHPALAIIDAPGTGVFAGVHRLVTNHPGALTSREGLRGAIHYRDGTPFAFHLEFGAGEFIALSDSSLFINLMRSAGDNSRLLANLGTWLSDGGERSVKLAAGATPLAGDYAGAVPASRAPGAAGRLNRAIQQLGIRRPDDVALRFAVALLLAILVLFALTVFPGGRPRLAPTLGLGRSPIADRMAGQPGGPAAPESAAASFPPPLREPAQRDT